MTSDRDADTDGDAAPDPDVAPGPAPGPARDDPEPDPVRVAVEEAHRREWASVLAATVRVTRDLDLAEECVQDAYAPALVDWARGGGPGRFALQAAIATLHASAPTYAETDWDQILVLYDALPDLLRRLGRTADAALAYERAIALSDNDAERAFLTDRLTATRGS
ncbi:hypothetical protein [Streptomyces sp. NPDC059943]|uniref:hypothetical protein n=1 Tax=Streptomyces sp. NPDC059943 TaxID=3347010 RepID=UPI00364603A8